MGGGRAAALLSRSSSSSLQHTVLSHHLGFRPLLSIRPFRGRGASVRMASDGAPQKDCSPAATTSPGSSSTSSSSAVDFLFLCRRLKVRRALSLSLSMSLNDEEVLAQTTKRAGWVRHGVREPESVADHMYRMGVMALISADLPGVDRERCIKMAIVHDIAEAIVGDITPADGVPKLEKSRREREALDHMSRLLGGGSRAKEISELWMEYEENTSLEAKLVKDLDKVEMILQALEYEIEQGMDLNEFFQSTAGKFQTDLGKAWASEIASRRKKKEE